MGTENRRWPKRCGPQPLQYSAFTVDRDYRDERQHCIQRYEYCRENRHVDSECVACSEMRVWSNACPHFSEQHEHEHRHQHSADGPERFPEEDLELDPREVE